MEHINMGKYSLVLDVNLSQLKDKLEVGQSFDAFIAKNFFPIITNKLKDLGIEGGVGFQHYAHHYTVNRKDDSDKTTV